jgi:hypothetical protein
MEFLEGLDPMLKTFWFIAIPVSIVFLVQAVMTFVGMDSSDGIEADFDADLDHGEAPFQLFSFRNLINFLLGFGWAGISFYHVVESRILLMGLAIAVGSIFVFAFFLMIQQIQRFAEDNTFKIESALNQVCSVYLSIPGNKGGKGKIQVSVKGTVHELDAITESNRIESGSMVRIIRIENNSLVVVEKL